MERALVMVLALGAACASEVGSEPDDAGRDPSQPDTGAADDAGAADGAAFLDGATPVDAGEAPDAVSTDAGITCATNLVPLLRRAERYFVAVSYEGRAAALQLDTGSGLSFLFQDASAPPYTPRVGELTLGCETLPMAGRNVRLPIDDVDGLPVIGLLGMNYLLAQPTYLDVAGGVLERFVEVPAERVAAARARIAFDVVQSHALVPLAIDGVAVRLLFDTGGGDTLWVGQQGRPGDRVDRVRDAQGTGFAIYTGTGTVTFPGVAPRVVTVARAPAFPYFEDTARALGGNVHGLLGVSTFPDEALLVAEQSLYLIARP